MIWGCFAIPLRHLTAYSATDILIYRIFSSLFISGIITLFFQRKTVKKDLAFLKSQGKRFSIQLVGSIIVSSVFITANWFSFIYVINHISVQSGAFAYMICPIITAVLGFFILKEKLSLLKWIAIFICIISISLLLKRFYVEVTYSVIIALLYAIYLIIQKKIEGISKFNVLVIQLTISALLVLPYYFLHYHTAPLAFEFWVNIIVISIIFTIIPLFLSLYALTEIPSSTMGIIIYMNPIVAFFISFFFFHEKVTGYQIISYSLLLLAVIIFNWHLIHAFFTTRRTTK